MPDGLRDELADAIHDCIEQAISDNYQDIDGTHPVNPAAVATIATEAALAALAGGDAADRDPDVDLRRRAEQAEATLARVRALHRVHRCAVDGHLLKRTPTPCDNNGLCSCGHLGTCPTAEILDTPEVADAQP